MGPQAQEDFHDSSTDSCLTFPYSSNSPRPFPPSPVHSVTASPERVSPLPIATSISPSDNAATHSSIVYTPPTPVPSTVPISRSSQTHPSVLLSPITNSYNTPLYLPYPSSSFSQAGPLVLPGISSILPYFGPSFPNTVPMPSQPLPPMSLPELYLFPSLLLDLSPALGLDLLGGQSGIPGVPFLGERELPGAEEVKLPPLPAVRPLPSPAISGLIFNPVESPLEVPPLIVPWT